MDIQENREKKKTMSARTYLKISVAVNIIIILFIAGKRLYFSRFSIAPDLKEKVYADQYDNLYKSVYRYLPIDMGDYVLFGTSITRGFPSDELLGPGFKNRGIGHNTTAHMLGRLEGLQHAKKVFVEAGINDFIIQGLPVATVVENYKQIVSRIGGARCVVQSSLPVGNNFPACADSIKKLNVLLKDYCGKNNIDFIDLHGIIGNMGNSNSVDGIHPNGKVYKIWAEAIRKYLAHSP